jgi:hypothetical protein
MVAFSTLAASCSLVIPTGWGRIGASLSSSALVSLGSCFGSWQSDRYSGPVACRWVLLCFCLLCSLWLWLFGLFSTNALRASLLWDAAVCPHPLPSSFLITRPFPLPWVLLFPPASVSFCFPDLLACLWLRLTLSRLSACCPPSPSSRSAHHPSIFYSIHILFYQRSIYPPLSSSSVGRGMIPLVTAGKPTVRPTAERPRPTRQPWTPTPTRATIVTGRTHTAPLQLRLPAHPP